MKRIYLASILILMAAACSLQALAGKFYGRTVFMGDVSVGTWAAMSDLSATVGYSSAGTYTNGSYLMVYRLSGTNLSGRLPFSTNLVVSWTGATNMSNCVTLSWGVYGGLAAYIVERSYDSGATWTNWVRVAPGETSFLDLGTNAWQTSAWTNGLAEIPAPTTPWTSPTSGCSTVQWVDHTNNTTTAHNIGPRLTAIGTQKWDKASGLASNTQRRAEIAGLQGFTNNFTGSGLAVETQDGFAIIRTTDGRTLFLVGGTNYTDFTKAALTLAQADCQLFSGASGQINLFTGPAGGMERFRVASNGVISAFGNVISNFVGKANSLSLNNGQAATNIATTGTSSISNAATLVTGKAMEEALRSGRAAGAISRYSACSTSGKEILVCATGSGVTATIVGTGISFSIPSGVRLLSARIRWPGTAGTTITLSLGTTDMANASLADRWGCTCAVYREDTGALISTAAPKLVTGTHDQIQILGLHDTQVNHIVVGF